MACQYFVGGRWVSENEFKALLNEGLLDTLVANNQIKVKNFKPDSARVKIADTKTITRSTVPAVKLAEILAQEIKTRPGYGLNMLSALELNEAKDDFKIPLWASPYAEKFESLLTSIVSNKVVKQKFPGSSFVLGSEEGVKIKQGDEAAGDLANSNIVFSSKFDPAKGLQPMRYDAKTKKILPAQIMIPFKFRNERGEVLNIKEFMTEDEDGRKILDTTKIPEKLLQLFGFRIPTQERNSMAAVEVVGFLPEAMGDLVLAPRDFTKQMGSDFDVDKLYTYMYNHFYQNGKLYTNFLSNPKKIEAQIKIAKETLKDIQDNLKLSKEDHKILRDYIKNTIDSNEEGDDINADLAAQANEIISRSLDKKFLEPGQIETLIDRISILNRSYKAARQNTILDVHLDIMTSNNPEIISSIIALDSFGEFDPLSKKINKIRSSKGANPAPLTILSDIYQRTKYINATAGKNGVGSFSLDSTFNAIAQGKDLVLDNLSVEASVDLFGTPMAPRKPTSKEILDANNPVATFGDVVSKGDLSNKYTLRSQKIIENAKKEKRELTAEEKASLKFKSNIIRALQSTAVDNEKEQILDKLNINDDTFGAIRAMVLLGFEEEDISGLITQEIIWEFLDRMRTNRSTISTYNPNFEQELLEELTKKYDPQNILQKATPEKLAAVEKLADISGKELIQELETGKFNPTTSTDYNLRQLMLLKKFMDLTEVGTEIKKIQSAINTESSGVPKKLIEVSTKSNQIKNLGFSRIFNAESLLGTIDKGILTPNTINGYAAYYGTLFANDIYTKYFPYRKQGFEKQFREILSHIPSGDSIKTSSAKLAELQNEFFNDTKAYFYSNQETNLFLGDPDTERARLFIDIEGKNMSLASILQNLSKESWYQRNAFLNKLTFNIQSNGTISRVNFEASNAANFDERNIYEGFSYLITKNVKIGDFNGIPYTTRTLAQDLVTAAFLEGGNQGAKQYLKYVPVAYLKTLGFGDYLSSINFEFRDTFGGKEDLDGNTYYSLPSDFTRQYFQNNPDQVKLVDLKDTGSKVVPGEFKLSDEALNSNFVSVVDPITKESTETQTHFVAIKDGKNFALYEFDEVKRAYIRIPTLQGSYGFTQYNSQNAIVKPVGIKEKVTPKKPDVVAPGTTIKNIPVEPTKKFDPNVVNNTNPNSKIAQLGINTNVSGKRGLDDIISRLLQDSSVSTTNKLLLDKLAGLTFPDGFKFEFVKDKGLRGRYNYDSRTLYININHEEHLTANDLATTVAHELIHTFTGESIKHYQAGNLDKLTAEQVDIIDNLKALQLSYINYLSTSEERAALQTFIDNYNNWSKADPATRKPFTTTEGLSKYYGAVKLTEFVTMALTDQGFQAYLNKVKVEDKSIMAQLKDLLLQLLNSLGIDIKAGSALASAVKETIDLIDSTQRKSLEDDVFFAPAPGMKATLTGFDAATTESSTQKPKLDKSKISSAVKQKSLPSEFKENDKFTPSPDDWDAFNRAFSDDLVAVSQLDEETYEKYLLICGK